MMTDRCPFGGCTLTVADDSHSYEFAAPPTEWVRASDGATIDEMRTERDDLEAKAEVAQSQYLDECKAHRATLAAYVALRTERDDLRAHVARLQMLLDHLGETLIYIQNEPHDAQAEIQSAIAAIGDALNMSPAAIRATAALISLVEREAVGLGCSCEGERCAACRVWDAVEVVKAARGETSDE